MVNIKLNKREVSEIREMLQQRLTAYINLKDEIIVQGVMTEGEHKKTIDFLRRTEEKLRKAQ